jgi:ubiquinone/menaquinone biosynthesis C-methylase UbiE
VSTAPVDIDGLKARIRSSWIAGDFGIIGRTVEEANEEIVGRLNIAPGIEWLDVACGTGNSAIPAARRGARVTGIDIAPNLLEQARARAKAAGVEARFVEGDAEQLAFPDASFDIVISVFGAMFAPRPDVVASELKRVCRRGGRIVMANWTPEGFAGEMFKLSARHMPPPPGIAPPVQWGDESVARERLRDGIAELKITRRVATLSFPFDEAQTVEHYRKYFGPTIKTFESLDAKEQSAFRQDLETLWKRHNQASDGTVRVESEFLEIIATRG